MFQLFDAFLLGCCDVRPCRNATTTTLGMSEFQKVRQLIPVSGVYYQFPTLFSLSSWRHTSRYGWERRI